MNRDPYIDNAIKHAMKRGGGDAMSGYDPTECDQYWKYVQKYWSGQGVSVFTDYNRGEIKCSIVVHSKQK